MIQHTQDNGFHFEMLNAYMWPMSNMKDIEKLLPTGIHNDNAGGSCHGLRG